MYIKIPLEGAGGGGTWGSITGTLSAQTDLQAALDAKENTFLWQMNPDRQSFFMLDFLQNDRGGLNVAANAGGGVGQINTNDSTQGLNTTENAQGCYGMVSGTGVTARSAMYSAGQQFIGGAKTRFGARVALDVLSSANPNYTAYVGFHDNPGAGDATDGIYFRYNHAVNSGKWEAVVADAGVRTAADTGVAAIASSEFVIFEVEFNQAGTEAKFYINGTLTNTVSSGLPGAGDFTIFNVKYEKSAGAASMTLTLDWLYLLLQRDSAR
jgi:hypothetical protein